LLELRVALVRDGYNIQQDLTEINAAQIVLYGRKNADLQNS
jgi:hypothetical protein